MERSQDRGAVAGTPAAPEADGLGEETVAGSAVNVGGGVAGTHTSVSWTVQVRHVCTCIDGGYGSCWRLLAANMSKAYSTLHMHYVTSTDELRHYSVATPPYNCTVQTTRLACLKIRQVCIKSHNIVYGGLFRLQNGT